MLSYAEFSGALGKHLGDEELMEIFQKIDQDHTNKIKYVHMKPGSCACAVTVL